MLDAEDIIAIIKFERSLNGPSRDIETVGGTNHLPGERDHQAFLQQSERDLLQAEIAKKALEISKEEI